MNNITSDVEKLLVIIILLSSSMLEPHLESPMQNASYTRNGCAEAGLWLQIDQSQEADE
jgi:hypothetical protein